MRIVDPLPSEFARFDWLGGVIKFAAADDSDGGDGDIAALLAHTVGSEWSFAPAALATLDRRMIDRPTFLGQFADPADGLLIARGIWSDPVRGRVLDPAFIDIGPAWSDGVGPDVPTPPNTLSPEFAYRFVHPIHPLQAHRNEVQLLFDQVCEYLLPNGEEVRITDFSFPPAQLPRLSNYFDAGLEFWGVMATAIYQPAMARLCVAIASTTD